MNERYQNPHFLEKDVKNWKIISILSLLSFSHEKGDNYEKKIPIFDYFCLHQHIEP